MINALRKSLSGMVLMAVDLSVAVCAVGWKVLRLRAKDARAHMKRSVAVVATARKTVRPTPFDRTRRQERTTPSSKLRARREF
jgi:hypothetical protein